MRRGAYPGSFNPATIAHLEIASAARNHHRLDRINLVISEQALDKEDVAFPTIEHRVEVIERIATRIAWLDVVVTQRQLLVDIAEGYDVLVMGADKYHQVHDPTYYYGSERARDDVIARLPRLAVAPRPPLPVPPDDTIPVSDLIVDVSSTAVRAGRRDWMPPEAEAFDRETGAWSDLERYETWLREHQ